MCGIVGTITSNFTQTKLDEWISDALLASQVRGLHSTGLFQIKSDFNSFRVAKRALNASEFIQIKDATEIISNANAAPCTIGHVRHATVGAKTDGNAHPFVAIAGKRRVIGVHNGTLQGWRFKAGSTGKDVDSAWAFHKLVEEGPIDAFEYFNGAYAFVWHDSEYPDHLFMARNDQRPLHYFEAEDNKTLLIASELGMLGWLAERNGFSVRKGKNPKPQFWYLKPDKVYKFSLKNIGEYEEMDRPAYDPKTTISQPVHYPQQGMYGRRDPDYYDQFDEAFWGYPRAGNDWGRSSRRPAVGYVSDQKRTLDGVKAALAEARKQLTGIEHKEQESDIVDSDVLDERLAKGIKDAINNFQANTQVDSWGLCNVRYTIPEPNTRNVSHSEMMLAKNLGMFGVAVAYMGVLYDDQTSETWGEAYVKMPKEKGVEKVDCILRGLSKGAADAQYINANNAVPVVVVGAMDDLKTNEITFIVAPVSKDALETLKSKMSSMSSSVN